MRGILIALEGLDRTGKTTQTAVIKQYLESLSHPTEVIHFPARYTQFGQQIDLFLKQKKSFDNELLHLLFSINRWELKPTILEKLNKGTSVILDRYSYSGVAYSLAKGLNADWCKTPEKGLPRPDLIIYLKPEKMEDVVGREGFGEEMYEKADFQRKVKEAYENHIIEKNWKIVNASQNIEDVSNEIRRIISEHLKNFNGDDIHVI